LRQLHELYGRPVDVTPEFLEPPPSSIGPGDKQHPLNETLGVTNLGLARAGSMVRLSLLSSLHELFNTKFKNKRKNTLEGAQNLALFISQKH
jgi:hypothetical protein